MPSRRTLFLLAALALAAAFVALALPYLDLLAHDGDEAWPMLDARLLARGRRPFVDFPHHEMPLQLYLLEASGALFGQTVFGYRMLSLLATAASGVVIAALSLPFVGALPALAAEMLFLFSPVQTRALTAVPETPMLLLSLVGMWCLFVGRGGRSAAVAGVVFVLALLTKSTAFPVVVAAATSLVVARDWNRLGAFALAGVTAAVLGLAWSSWLSDGIFLEILRFQLARIGTRQVGMWTFDSGFRDLMQNAHIDRPSQLALSSFKTFYQVSLESVPLAIVALAFIAVPVWVFRCVRERPAFRAFIVLWPAWSLITNFVVLDFVTPRYFIPFHACAALLSAAWVWLLERRLPSGVVAVVGLAVGLALAVHTATVLESDRDLWFWGRTQWIAEHHPRVVSFSPIFFAATGSEPGCDLANPALTYGAFGEALLTTPRTRGFRFSDERLIQCLRADPTIPVVVDWSFYFFTRPGSLLRRYLDGEGSAQRLYFSPESVEQWSRPLLRMNPFR